MEDTYLYLIPKEIFDLILLELDVKDIISILGSDFHKDRVTLCKNILTRDYGKYENSKLLLKKINTSKVDWIRYDDFLEKFKSHMRQIYGDIYNKSTKMITEDVHVSVNFFLKKSFNPDIHLQELSLYEVMLNASFNNILIKYHKKNGDKLINIECIIENFDGVDLISATMWLCIKSTHQSTRGYFVHNTASIEIDLETPIYVMFYYDENTVFNL